MGQDYVPRRAPGTVCSMSGAPDLASTPVPRQAGETAGRVPSPRLWHMRSAEVATVSLALAVAAATGAALVAGLAGAVAALAVVAAGGLVMLRFVRARFRSWMYQERDEDLIVERGVMFRRLSVVPYGRMQFVDVTAGPVERAFRLATVRLHTAAAASDARIPGLERDEAARLRDRLAALGEARAAGL